MEDEARVSVSDLIFSANFTGAKRQAQSATASAQPFVSPAGPRSLEQGSGDKLVFARMRACFSLPAGMRLSGCVLVWCCCPGSLGFGCELVCGDAAGPVEPSVKVRSNAHCQSPRPGRDVTPNSGNHFRSCGIGRRWRESWASGRRGSTLLASSAANARCIFRCSFRSRLCVMHVSSYCIV